MIRTFLTAAVLGCAASLAQATVLEFDAPFSDPGTETVIDQGYTYQDNTIYFRPGVLYLHDDAGLTTSTLTRVDGRRFTPLRAEIGGKSYLYRAYAGPHPDGDSFYEYPMGSPTGPLMHLLSEPLTFRIDGYRGATYLGSVADTFVSQPFTTVEFGTAFRDVDRLVMSLIVPGGAQLYSMFEDALREGDPLPYGAGALVCHEWCGDLEIDSMTIAPVPLPAGLVLLGSGIGVAAVGLRARRRRG